MASWLQRPSDVCASKPCSGTDKCVSVDKSHLCLNTDCSEPLSTLNGASLEPGPISIGSVRLYVCPNGTKMQGNGNIMCNGSSWSTPQFTCDKVCPSDDWITFGTNCYLFGTTGLYYSEARVFCDTFDNDVLESNLVQVDTTDELEFLKTNMKSLPGVLNGYWNDLFQTDKNREERCRSSNDALNVPDWSGNQPDDYKGNVQSCTAFFKVYSYKQVDVNCVNSVRPTERNHAAKCSALCEIPLN